MNDTDGGAALGVDVGFSGCVESLFGCAMGFEQPGLPCELAPSATGTAATLPLLAEIDSPRSQLGQP